MRTDEYQTGETIHESHGVGLMTGESGRGPGMTRLGCVEHRWRLTVEREDVGEREALGDMTRLMLAMVTDLAQPVPTSAATVGHRRRDVCARCGAERETESRSIVFYP